VDCIIIARPTQSAVLYKQMLGRGTRTYPGKTDCLVLDVVGVSTHHTLHTAATLFDCDAERLARQSVLEFLERPAHPDQEDTALTGTLRITPVDLFARRALRWVQTRQGAWVLSLGAQHGTLRLRPDGPETWQVVQVRRDAEAVQLGDTLPLPYAQGLAEGLCAAPRGGAPGGGGGPVAPAPGHGETDGAAAQAGDGNPRRADQRRGGGAAGRGAGGLVVTKPLPTGDHASVDSDCEMSFVAQHFH